MYVTVDLSGLKKFQRLIDEGLRGRSGPIRKAVGTWPEIYGGEMSERFVRMSQGGWPPLKQSTIERRRHGYRTMTRKGTWSKGKRYGRGKRALAAAIASGGGQVMILRDTGTLFNVVGANFVGAPGAMRQDIDYGVRVGFGGPGRHPRGRASVADIATFHQFGLGRNPRREILVAPQQRTLDTMARAMENGLAEAVQQSDIGR